MGDIVYSPANIKVLIIDDYELIRKSIAKVLRKNNFQDIYECSNEREAIELFNKHLIDLIFCDLYMEKGGGFEFLSYVRSQNVNSDIPFIVVTGEASKEGIVKAANLGAEDYVVKPFQSGELEKKVHQVLMKYQSPTPMIHYLRRAERYLLERKLDMAGEFVKKSIDIDPTSSRANHLHAVILDAMNQTKKAIEVLKDSIGENPSFLKNYVSLADYLIKIGDIPAAIKAMKDELNINPKQCYRQIQLGKMLFQVADFDGAIEHLRLALLEDSKDPSALFEIGRAYACRDNLEKAIYYFKRLRRYHHDNTEALDAAVKYSIKAGHPKIAENMLLDEKKSASKRLDSYVALSKLYIKTERLDEAAAVLEECLKKDPDYLDALKVLAIVSSKKNDFETAIQAYYKLAGKSTDIDNYLKLSELLIAKESYLEAIDVLQRALRTEKEVAKVFHRLAIATMKTKQVTKAYLLFLKLQNIGVQGDGTILRLSDYIKKRRAAAQKEPKAS